MLIIASISDQITECCSVFWKDMEKYIKKDFLSIDGDELTHESKVFEIKINKDIHMLLPTKNLDRLFENTPDDDFTLDE